MNRAWIPPVAPSIDPLTGQFEGATRHYQKHFSQLAGLYADEAAFQQHLLEHNDPVVYEVWEHKASAGTGDLIFGTSVLQPGTVGAEFFFTAGHQHALPDRAETYYCLSGEGVMLMESPDGDLEVRSWSPGVMLYVPPYWIHRSVNTGSQVLVTLFTYSADAGQNYDLLRQHGGMRQRVFRSPQGWTLKDNLAYLR